MKQADGKVRCGACGNAFSALEFLSETRPEQPSEKKADVSLPELTPDPLEPDSSIQRVSPEQRERLLNTLDQLAGSDVRIEDTGVEWRVLQEDIGEESDIDAFLDESPAPVDEQLTPTTVEADEIFEKPNNPFSGTIADELRFDDNTPLPDDLDPDQDSPDMPEAADAEQDDADAEGEEAGPTTDDSGDEAADEQDDWADILGEFDETAEGGTPPLEAELAAIEREESEESDAGEEGGEGEADTENETDEQAADSGHDADDEVEERSTGEDAADDDTGSQGDDEDATPLEFGSIADAAADPTLSSDDADEAIADSDDDFWGAGPALDDAKDRLVTELDDAPGFESIVMEGDIVRSELDKEKLAVDQAAATELAEQVRAAWEAENAKPTFGKSYGMTVAVIGLVALLLVQIVHQSRDALATVPIFNSIAGPLYQAVGMPISPDWDITVWRFEATRGIADENNEKLTVQSRIGNTSDRLAPYPLIGITLTDRFEESVASRVLEPAEYLAGDLDILRPVAPGSTFDAVIAIQAPPAEATGFKLKVCYPMSGEQLRCAVDGFK